MTNQRYPFFFKKQSLLAFFCEVMHIIMKLCITIPGQLSPWFHICGYLPEGSSFGRRKVFQNLHIAQIKNLCLLPAVLLSAGQWKALPSASGIPAWSKAWLRMRCGATGTVRYPGASAKARSHPGRSRALSLYFFCVHRTARLHWRRDPSGSYPVWLPWGLQTTFSYLCGHRPSRFSVLWTDHQSKLPQSGYGMIDHVSAGIIID